MIEKRITDKGNTALWALTSQGAALAKTLSEQLKDCDLFFSDRLDRSADSDDNPCTTYRFESLRQTVSERFNDYSAHVFFMATGIVIRVIAEHIVHKTHDPAVVVVDDRGTFAISLLSGHIGGANDLTLRVSAILGATPVITTATDVNYLPSVDMMAVYKKLTIENPDMIKRVNMAFINGKQVGIFDPYGFLSDQTAFDRSALHDVGVCIDDRLGSARPGDLVLRPKTLVAGIGCNRGTEKSEIRELLFETLEQNELSWRSLALITSVDVKQDETGILELADELKLPLTFFSRDELNTIETIETPSLMVEKHIGVKSVCEAAAILGAGKGNLIVPKRKSTNATVAVARINYTS